ncbi:MAG: hypothetical protein QM755_06450 [Luteolibacter sp.]
MSAEQIRLDEDCKRVRNWKRWGPYLSERQWATVREDYSADGEAWNSFPHDQARSRAYRWGEDGLLGFTDRECRLCFSLALWNGRDPILKERLFGLTGSEGNHGEDVKECYYYLDSTPTHSYAKALYKYPHASFPYEALVQENGRRRDELVRREYELTDTGIFDENRYHDIFVEYAKGGPDDICIRITLANRGPEASPLHLLPNLWFRNVWSWGWKEPPPKPSLWLESPGVVHASHATLGEYRFTFDGDVPVLFTENDSNTQRLWDQSNATPFVKDAFHRHVIDGETDAINPANSGTKCTPHFQFDLAAGETRVVHLRLTRQGETAPDAESVFADRIREADEFYAKTGAEARQAYAGLLWSKQYLPLRREILAGRRPRRPATSSLPSDRPQLRLDPRLLQ